MAVMESATVCVSGHAHTSNNTYLQVFVSQKSEPLSEITTDFVCLKNKLYKKVYVFIEAKMKATVFGLNKRRHCLQLISSAWLSGQSGQSSHQ